MSDENPGAPGCVPDGQLIVALSVVAAITVITVALVVAGAFTGKWDVLSVGIGTGIGALATALNAPTGVANALRAAMTKPDPAQ